MKHKINIAFTNVAFLRMESDLLNLLKIGSNLCDA